MRSRFALLAAFLLCALAVRAKSPTAKVDVHVTTLDGAPIEHAEVTVKVMKGDKTSTRWKVRTTADGTAQPPPEVVVPQGPIIVEVRAEGYASFSQNVPGK